MDWPPPPQIEPPRQLPPFRFPWCALLSVALGLFAQLLEVDRRDSTQNPNR